MTTRSPGRGRVVVVGSANVDVVLRVERLPAPGETVLAGSSTRGPGGKGANQAIAASRSGAATSLLAAVGSDDGAALLLPHLEAAGVGLTLLRTLPAATGSAVVLVDARGENSIVVAAGANAALSGLTEADRRALTEADVVVAQLEVPHATVEEALAHARGTGALTVLNAAPAAALSPGLLRATDVLLVNESEAAELSGRADPRDAALVLAQQVTAVVVTLGASGALVASGHELTPVPGTPAREVVDTTGAGDAFCGAFAAARAAGLDTVAAVRRACLAGSLAVERHGAGTASPLLHELLDREGGSPA